MLEEEARDIVDRYEQASLIEEYHNLALFYTNIYTQILYTDIYILGVLHRVPRLRGDLLKDDATMYYIFRYDDIYIFPLKYKHAGVILILIGGT